MATVIWTAQLAAVACWLFWGPGGLSAQSSPAPSWLAAAQPMHLLLHRGRHTGKGRSKVARSFEL